MQCRMKRFSGGVSRFGGRKESRISIVVHLSAYGPEQIGHHRIGNGLHNDAGKLILNFVQVHIHIVKNGNIFTFIGKFFMGSVKFEL